jgi:hypothetical protein
VLPYRGFWSLLCGPLSVTSSIRILYIMCVSVSPLSCCVLTRCGGLFCLLRYAARPPCLCLPGGLVPPFTACMRYLVFNSCNTSNIGLWTSLYMHVSFVCNLVLVIIYMVFFQYVQMFSPFLYFYDFHCVSYTPTRVSNI